MFLSALTAQTVIADTHAKPGQENPSSAVNKCFFSPPVTLVGSSQLLFKKRSFIKGAELSILFV